MNITHETNQLDERVDRLFYMNWVISTTPYQIKMADKIHEVSVKVLEYKEKIDGSDQTNEVKE